MIERALIVQQPWADKILSGEKLWEMRSRPTLVRERIGIIAAGTGLILGEVNLTDSPKAIDLKQANQNLDKHQVANISLLEKWCFAWVLNNPKRYETPVKYKHPRGAVTWVKLEKQL